MAFFAQLRTKPWLSDNETARVIEVPPTPGKTALKFFLAVVSMMFMLFIITFLSRSQFGDFQALAGEPWLPLQNRTQLWLNTLFIAIASVLLQLATRQKNNQTMQLIVLVTGAVICSLVFIYGQFTVWQTLNDSGYLVYSNPANSFFYLLTALHGLHLFGGLMFLLHLLYKLTFSQQDENATASCNTNLKLVTIYWHYLFLLWLLLFALLTSSTQTFKAIALLCGF
ncbi:cytochrome oxidase subunit III [Colwelliaceae bacterium BS250]